MIAIINYNAGNIASVANALKKLGYDYVITNDKNIIGQADKIIFPGQGRVGQAMRSLKKYGLASIIKSAKTPFLGICLGLQMLSSYSMEDKIKCLNLIPGKVIKFQTNKIPQIGWNKVKINKKSLLTRKFPNNSYFYFANSYYLKTKQKYIIGETDYEITFPSIINKNNFYATQFHPEKSGVVGLRLLKNFCEIC